MKNVIRAILVLMILSLGVTAGHAQLMSDPNDPTLEVMYQDYGDQSGTSGGASVYYCAAKGSWGGYCRACTTVNGMLTCGDSKYSAKCECSGSCNPYKGMCTYER